MDLKKLTYFYGCITREEAEQYLTNNGLTDGLYLLRQSRSSLRGYTLSVVCKQRFYHYHIAHQSDGSYAMDKGPSFSGPVKLCEFHHRDGDGMCCLLKVPCSRPPGVSVRASFFDSRKEKDIRDYVARTHKLQGMELEGYVVQHRSRLEREVAENLHRSMSWFHGVIARKEAERRLLEASQPIPDGKFLVRERAQTFAISVTHNKKVCHYMVERNSAGKLFVSEGIIFDTLWQMVEHYKSKPDGLLTSLKQVCPAPEPAYCSPEQPSLYIEEDLLVLDHENELGKGNFGSVVPAIYKRPTKEIRVAVKMLKQAEEGDSMKADILKEALIMQKLQHRHIVMLYGVCPGDPFMLVLELVPFGPLNKYLRSQRVKITVAEITELMYQVALGMEYLEEKNVVHRDLAARNVLLADKNTAKISDFGLSRAVESDCYQTSTAGKWPLKWFAPESIEYYTFTSRSDVWSFGVTLWEAFSYGSKPYSDKRGNDVLKFLKDGHRLPAPPGSPSVLCDLMARCWLARASKEFSEQDTSEFKKHQALLFAAMNNSYLTSESHNQVMVAKEGDNVTLHCLLQAHCQMVNVSITWTLFGVNGEFRQVFAFENGEKMSPLFDSRVVWLGGTDIRRPAISLSRLEIGDGGSYTCRAQCDNNTSEHSIKLNVTKIEIPKVKKLYANYNVSGTEIVSSSVKESAHAGVLVTAVLLSSALFFILVSLLLGLALKRLKQRRQRLEEERRRRLREASRKRYFCVQNRV